ncbi:MAG: response regulator transcription factor [Bacteroidetes bacterium]|nr:response regulator transcription factor [Bacteroidota bacterium]
MNFKINCIIIDDDPEVVTYVKAYISDIPFLNLVATYTSSALAIERLVADDVKLIFLDIHLPGINGMEFAKTIYDPFNPNKPRIIFISGSEDYVRDGYKVDALDYLLKPFSFEDLFKAAYKARIFFESQAKLNAGFIMLKVEHELVRVPYDKILYIESVKDYVKVYLSEGAPVTALSTLKSLEEQLPAKQFLRVHRSFIVATEKIDSIHSYTIKIGKITIPVSDPYKPNFRQQFQAWF